MFRLILSLPFDVLLVVKAVFDTEAIAWWHWNRCYRSFTAFEVWPQADVDQFKGLHYLIGSETI